MLKKYRERVITISLPTIIIILDMNFFLIDFTRVTCTAASCSKYIMVHLLSHFLPQNDTALHTTILLQYQAIA